MYACLPYSIHNLVRATCYGYTTITDPKFVSKLHLNYSHHINLPSYMPPIGMGPICNGTHALFFILFCFFFTHYKIDFFLHYFSVWHLGNHYLQFIIHVWWHFYTLWLQRNTQRNKNWFLFDKNLLWLWERGLWELFTCDPIGSTAELYMNRTKSKYNDETVVRSCSPFSHMHAMWLALTACWNVINSGPTFQLFLNNILLSKSKQ